jgi:KDO2-lipid IV(A) lauroyltransferase
LDIASAFAGFIGRMIGPLLGVNRVARKNLKLCFPGITEAEIKDIIAGMWENLGRMIGEIPHVARMTEERFKKIAEINSSFDDYGNGAMLLSGHYGNFELAAIVAKTCKSDISLVHRPANNPYVNKLINGARQSNSAAMINKGIIGVKDIVSQIVAGKVIGMLVDQKTNNGITADFFNIPSKCTSLPAKMALRYGAKLYLGRMMRKKGARFIVDIYGPLEISPSDDEISITNKINKEIENWIKKDPKQWFWIHNRWKA